MRPHPTPHRIRKTIKWGGAAVTVLLVVVWIASGWCALRFRTGHRDVVASWGQIYVMSPAVECPPSLRGGSIIHHPFQFRWDTDRYEVAGVRIVIFPFWPLWTVSLLITAAAWILDALAARAPTIPCCPRCGYDRTRMPLLAECPECGSGGILRPLRRLAQRPGLNAIRIAIVLAAALAIVAALKRFS